MPDPINTLPCHCKWGHPFTRSRAAQLGYKCDKDGEPILCDPTSMAPPEGKEANHEPE